MTVDEFKILPTVGNDPYGSQPYNTFELQIAFVVRALLSSRSWCNNVTRNSINNF